MISHEETIPFTFLVFWSRINDIKERKRQSKQVTPTAALSEPIEATEEENNVGGNEEKNIGRNKGEKVERKRVSFDLRKDLHKELKMQSLLQEKNIYVLIEEALEDYLEGNK